MSIPALHVRIGLDLHKRMINTASGSTGHKACPDTQSPFGPPANADPGHGSNPSLTRMRTPPQLAHIPCSSLSILGGECSSTPYPAHTTSPRTSSTIPFSQMKNFPSRTSLHEPYIPAQSQSKTTSGCFRQSGVSNQSFTRRCGSPRSAPWPRSG